MRNTSGRARRSNGPPAISELLEWRRLLSGTTVGYWRFEEGTTGQAASSNTGAILDSSGNGYNGTAINAPVYESSVAASVIPQTGQTNKLSMSFNGSSQRVTIPDETAFELSSSLTIEAYIDVQKITSGQEQILFRGDDRTGHDPYYLQERNGTLRFQVENEAGTGADVTTPLPGTNEWLYVAGELNGATGVMSIYVNGQLMNSITTSVRPYGPLVSNKLPGIGIGNVQSGNYKEYFDGLIDEVRLSNVALPPSQFLDAASFAVLDDGVLSVTGTAGNDTIDVTDSAGAVVASLNGQKSSPFTLSEMPGGLSIDGGAGDDFVAMPDLPISATVGGAGGNDTINGGSDGDLLKGGAGNDSILGGSGNDVLHGGTGNDTLAGGAGSDSVNGNAGNDSITAGPGSSNLYPGPGVDTIVGSVVSGYGEDTITLDSDDSVRAGNSDEVIGANATDTVNRS